MWRQAASRGAYVQSSTGPRVASVTLLEHLADPFGYPEVVQCGFLTGSSAQFQQEVRGRQRTRAARSIETMDDDEALLREIDSEIRLHDLVLEEEQDFSRSFGSASFGIGKENQKNTGATNLNRFTLEELSAENLYDVQASGAGGTGFDSGPPRGRAPTASSYTSNLASYASRLVKPGASGSGQRLSSNKELQSVQNDCDKGKGKVSHDGTGVSARLYKLGLRAAHKKDELVASALEEEDRRVMRSKPEMSARSRSLTGGRKPNEAHHGNYGHFLYEQGLKEKEKKQQASNAMHQVGQHCCGRCPMAVRACALVHRIRARRGLAADALRESLGCGGSTRNETTLCVV